LIPRTTKLNTQIYQIANLNYSVKAADMYELKWSNELAKVAQEWANQCDFSHDANRVRRHFYITWPV
jgi:uncharacterized protein YkwD